MFKSYKFNRPDFTLGNIIGEVKWSEEIKCDLCGNSMDLISIEEGYSCKSEDCIAHIKERV